MNRRSFLIASTSGIAGYRFARPSTAAPSAYRGPFDPIKTTAPGMSLCEHLPLTAKQGRHIAVVQGVTDGGRATGDHHAGYYYNLTGHAPDMTFRTPGK